MENIELSKEDLQKLLDSDSDSIKEYFSHITHAADFLEIFRQVEFSKWPYLLSLVGEPEMQALIVSELHRGEWQELLGYLSRAQISQIIRELESDDVTDLLADVPLENRFKILKTLPREERLQIQKLLRYPKDSAGGIMQAEYAKVESDKNIGDAINIVRKLVEDDISVQTVWIVDTEDRLIGSLEISDLLLNKSETNVLSIMDDDIVFIRPLMDQEEVAHLFSKYDLITAPVVDEQNHILGRIVVDDIIDVLREEHEDDTLQMVGTSRKEFHYNKSVFSTARLRLPWLGVALFCSLVSAFLLHFFESTLEKAAIVISFLPVINAMGGNVGTQTSTLLIRGFATEHFELTDIPQFLLKEIRVAIFMGAIYGLLAGLVGFLFLTNHNIYLGFVVFISMIAAMMTAAILGVTTPAMLKRFDIDPAIASGPFVTTLNDITGIAIYMLICTAFLQRLQIG